MSVALHKIPRRQLFCGFTQLRRHLASLHRHRFATCCQSAEQQAFSNSSILFLGSVWPEVTSSAAGVRTFDLLSHFRQTNNKVTFVSSAQKEGNTHAARLEKELSIEALECLPNREDEFASILQRINPEVVVFDRFYIEEAFSFRVRELVPNCLRVLDMQDVHFLRGARQKLVAAGEQDLSTILNVRPKADNVDVLRELAAIHRSDLTLVCSPEEERTLHKEYGIPMHKMVLAPFFAPASPYNTEAPGSGASLSCPGYSERQHFIMIGNFKHPPNVDAIRWTCKQIWPAIRAQLPDAELHIYGAYPPTGSVEFHQPKKGVHLRGFAPSLEIMLQYRAMVAPLRFGAGLKGKIVDAWWHGLPVITTAIGAEGMHLEPYLKEANTNWGGLWKAETATKIAEQAVDLYKNETLWHECQKQGFTLLSKLYDRQTGLRRIDQAIQGALQSLEEQRLDDFVGGMLWREEARSTQFFSRWLELKESLKPTSTN